MLFLGLATKGFDDVVLPSLDPRLVLPICVLSEEAFRKPSNDWIDTAQTLLKNTEQESQLEINSPVLIRDAFNKQPERPTWEILLKTLPLKIQLDVLYRLSVNRPPTRNDWQNLYTKVTYDLRTSWHYRLILPIAFSLSFVALFGALDNSMRSSELLMREASIVSTFYIVPIVWLVFLKGLEEPFEPNLFIGLGLWGPISFCKEYRRLLHNEIVWNGTQAIFDTITQIKYTRFACIVAVAFVAAFALIDTGAGTFAVVDTAAVAFAFSVTFAGAVAGAGTFAFADAEAVAVALLDAFIAVIAFVVLAITDVALALAVASTFAVAGVGLGFWVRQRKKHNFSRYFAILAAPFFLGSPVVVVFSTLFMNRVAGFSWSFVGLAWLGIVSIFTLLLKLGRRKERLAQNPLKGILPDYT